MNRSSMRVFGLLAALAVLSFGLAGCGGDEPSTVSAPPAPPPAPPPFQPQPVEVQLGPEADGAGMYGTITLMTTEAGGHTLDGEAFESGGTVEGEGGRMYALTLADGTWTAAFQSQSIEVTLGTSEEMATLMTTEDGGFTMDDEAFVSGGTATTEAGANYTLTMGEDGTWMAMFAPMEVMVALGTSDDSATLMTVEGGGFTMDGEAFESGGMAMNMAGESYTLTLGEDGTWSAMHMPREVMVALGDSGEQATLMSTEAGGYTLAGEAVTDGGMAMNSAGESYTLMMGEDGMWMATHMPMTATVTLGTSGNTVDLMTNEAGMWMIGDTALKGDDTDTYTMGGLTYGLAMDDEGIWMATFMPMEAKVTLGITGEMVTLMTTEAGGWARDGSGVETSGFTATATNGNNYTLMLGDDGMWMATFAPMRVDVTLGTSGDTATLWTAEAVGTYTRNGQAFVPGSTVMNSYEESYTLTLAEGMWTAAHMPQEQTPQIGISGNVTLMTNEAGQWTMDGNRVATGDPVEGNDNAATGMKNMYVLTLADDGSWSAAYQARTMDIDGTGLQAMAREDGTGYTVGAEGSGMSLDADGAGEVTGSGGGMFRVMKDADGMLAGTRFDADIVTGALHLNSKGDEGKPTLSGDNKDMPGNQENTMVNAVGVAFSMGDLLGGGSATATGPNIVAKARGEIVKIRNRVVQLVALAADDSGFNLDAQLRTQWESAEGIVQGIFNSSEELEKTYSASRVVDAFDRIVEALGSAEAFAAATLKDGPDRLQGLMDRNASQAAQAFGRPEWTAEAHLGALGSTRFGAATRKGTSKAQSAPAADRSQAFAWSTMQDTRRATDVQVSGFASYEGETRAADQDGNLYSGSIDIEVRFTRMAVDGLVTGLARADTDAPFTHGLGGEVTSIVLPTARLDTRGDWKVMDRSNSNLGRLSFETRAGGSPDEDLASTSEFSGNLLGRDDAAGDEAIGTWQAIAGSTTLVGGFGATRGADRAPPGTGLTGDLAKIGKTGDDRALLEQVPTVELDAIVDNAGTPDVDEARPEVPANVSAFNPGATNTQFRYIPQPPDTPAGAGGAEFVVGNYTPQRAAVLEDGEFEMTKGNWVADARAEIAKKLAQLRRSIALDNADASAGDTKFANDQRQRLFNEIQAELRNVFGPGTPAIDTGVLSKASTALGTGNAAWTEHEDYPVNTAGVAQDAGVLNEIEDVLAALEDAEAFAAALEEGGAFAEINLATLFGTDAPGASAIFNRPRGKLSFVSEATDYTRLGAWRHQVSEYAADGLTIQSYPRGDRGAETGSFAYSPLDPTAAYSGATSRLYPASGAAGRVTATYAGQTAAVQGDTFYRGDVEAKVYWDNSTVTDSEVKVTVSNLLNTDSGDTLQFGYAQAGSDLAGVVDVETLTWTAKVTNSGVVRFAAETDGGDSVVDVAVAVDSITGTPNWRPAYGPYRAVGATTELSTAEQADYGPGIAGNRLRHFQSSTLSELRIAVTSGDLTGQKWVANVGAGGGGDLGAVTFKGLGTGRHTLTMTTSGNAFDEAKAKFEAGQANLIYPTHVISGIRTTKAAGQPKAGERDSRILLFADGSTAHMHEHFDHDIPLIGTTGNPAEHTTATRFTGTPNLQDRDDLLWFDYGQSYHAFPELDGDETTVIGVGAPDGAPGSVAKLWFDANEYVNVAATDPTARDSTLNGMFVGQDQDGPLGLIGTWTLTGGAFGTGTERGDIRGSFGADIQP